MGRYADTATVRGKLTEIPGGDKDELKVSFDAADKFEAKWVVDTLNLLLKHEEDINQVKAEVNRFGYS